jgi:hypothetical protein
MKNNLEIKFQEAKNEFKKYLVENPHARGRISGAIYIDQDLLIKAIQANSRGYKCKNGVCIPIIDYIYECGSSRKEALRALSNLCYYLKADDFYEAKKCCVGTPYLIEMDCLEDLFLDIAVDFLSCGETFDDYWIKSELLSTKDGITMKLTTSMRSSEDAYPISDFSEHRCFFEALKLSEFKKNKLHA